MIYFRRGERHYRVGESSTYIHVEPKTHLANRPGVGRGTDIVLFHPPQTMPAPPLRTFSVCLSVGVWNSPEDEVEEAQQEVHPSQTGKQAIKVRATRVEYQVNQIRSSYLRTLTDFADRINGGKKEKNQKSNRPDPLVRPPHLVTYSTAKPRPAMS